MDLTAADGIMSELRRMRLDAADKPTTISALAGVQRLRGILDTIEIEAAGRLHDLAHNAPAELAAATQRSRHDGDRVYARAATLAAVPSLVEPLRTGRIQAAHIDTVARVMRTVEDKHAFDFAAVLPDFIEAAASSNTTPDDLARTLNRAARALENNGGVSRFHQQRRDTALHTWTDKRTGMFRLSGRFDPMSGVLLHNRIQAMLAALFTERVPSTCPADPGAKQDHLRALALLALTVHMPRTGLSLVPDAAESDRQQSGDTNPNDEGYARHAGTPSTQGSDDVTNHNETNSTSAANGTDADRGFDEWLAFFRGGPSRLGRPEIVVVVDARQQTLDANGGTPVVDWGLPVELPPRALEDLFQRADAHPVIVHNGAVLHAPGEMNLGRTTRLASRAQRRALRALYPTCAVPACCVAYEFTKPHHVHYWEHGGPTDLANLLPVCSKHHHAIHEGGWKLTLRPDRQLTITLPDGTILTTGPPPRIRAT